MIMLSGTGKAVGHHGELMQGMFEDIDGIVRRGLVSLRCPSLISTATFSPLELADFTVSPPRCEKARRAGELAMKTFARKPVGGHLDITSAIPIGRGMGSSTADVLAAIHAVLNYLVLDPSPEDIMSVAVSAETACDSRRRRRPLLSTIALMIDNSLHW